MHVTDAVSMKEEKECECQGMGGVVEGEQAV